MDTTKKKPLHTESSDAPRKLPHKHKHTHTHTHTHTHARAMSVRTDEKMSRAVILKRILRERRAYKEEMKRIREQIAAYQAQCAVHRAAEEASKRRSAKIIEEIKVLEARIKARRDAETLELQETP